MSIVSVCHYRTFVAVDVVVVIDVEAIGELWFQSWVTLCDVKRIAVICNIEQLSDVWLSCISPIMKPYIALVAEFIVEVKRRREVCNVSDGVYISPTIVLYEIGALRLNQESYVIIVLLLPMSEGKSHVMGIVLVF